MRGKEAQWQEVCLLKRGKGNKELGIVAVVEVLDEVAEDGQVWEDLGYFWGFHYLIN